MNILTTLSTILIYPLKNGHAYLDPGSGSFILQLLIASLVGGFFIVKTYWKKILAFFRGQPSEAEDDQEE
jgi:hypothetical protein